MTKTEVKLLELLVANKGQLVTRAEILEKVWNIQPGECHTNAVRGTNYVQERESSMPATNGLVIQKFGLKVVDQETIDMPLGAQVLTVQVQQGSAFGL